MIEIRLPRSQVYLGKLFLRLESLKAIREELSESEDHTEHLPNVDALIEAYRSGKLDWSPGYVAFWSKGKQLGRAKEFDTNDFLKVNKKHNGHKGFWVEGVCSPVILITDSLMILTILTAPRA